MKWYDIKYDMTAAESNMMIIAPVCLFSGAQKCLADVPAPPPPPP